MGIVGVPLDKSEVLRSALWWRPYTCIQKGVAESTWYTLQRKGVSLLQQEGVSSTTAEFRSQAFSVRFSEPLFSTPHGLAFLYALIVSFAG